MDIKITNYRISQGKYKKKLLPNIIVTNMFITNVAYNESLFVWDATTVKPCYNEVEGATEITYSLLYPLRHYTH